MPRFDLDLNPVQHITVDAIGQPGARVFYIQGWRETDPQPVTIIIEKVQLESLDSGRGPDAGRTCQAEAGTGRPDRRC